MDNQEPYEGKWTALSVRTSLKATGIVIAGATMMIVALAIAKGDSDNSGSPEGGKFVGVRRPAVSMLASADALPNVAAPAASQGQDTIVRNGVTIVSPQLRVPVVDIDALRTANGSEDGISSPDGSDTRNRSRYAKHAHTRRHSNRWPAYGVAFR